MHIILTVLAIVFIIGGFFGLFLGVIPTLGALDARRVLHIRRLAAASGLTASTRGAVQRPAGRLTKTEAHRERLHHGRVPRVAAPSPS